MFPPTINPYNCQAMPLKVIHFLECDFCHETSDGHKTENEAITKTIENGWLFISTQPNRQLCPACVTNVISSLRDNNRYRDYMEKP